MNAQDPIVLHIILRQSLQFNNSKTTYCVANAVQHILLKYFTLQVLSVKTHNSSLIKEDYLKDTTKWLSSQSKKTVLSVDENVWCKIKHDFLLGKDIFSLKEMDNSDVETTLIMWPIKQSTLPSYLKELTPII